MATIDFSKITTQTLTYAPALLAGVQAAELAAPLAPGESKLAAVVGSVVEGVGGAATALQSSPNPDIAGAATLASVFVFIFNSLGTFKHKATTPTVTP